VRRGFDGISTPTPSKATARLAGASDLERLTQPQWSAMKHPQDLTIAYTPDSDDAFYYYALETGLIRLAGLRLNFRRAVMSELNRAALTGQYPITAISSVLYPQVADRYAILSVGTSVGRGYGPVLVSQRHEHVEELAGKRVGVGGIPTTGWFLLRWLCPKAIPVEMPFDRIAASVAAGEIAAGVMIHEELLYYPRLGLRRVVDLGAEWCRCHGLPLPVGLNLVRRDLGYELMERLCDAVRRSLLRALQDRDEALAWVSQFGRGTAGACAERFVEMFANEDSLCMPADVRRALFVLFEQVRQMGGRIVVPEIIEGTPLVSRVPHPAIS
jgi:1,4-dihydroxy-6-naphthoate synthase